MEATLTIRFTDGTQKDITLAKAIEMDLGADRAQSLEFRQTKSGEWVMSFHKRLMEGKRLAGIEMSKNV